VNRYINFDQYPLDDLNSNHVRDLIIHARDELRRNGSVELSGFLLDETIQHLIRELSYLKSDGHRMDGSFSPYSDDLSDLDTNNLPGDHPARIRLPASHIFVAGDRIDPCGPLWQLYKDYGFINFVSEIVGASKLFPLGDEMGSINYLVYEHGDCNGWHFDTTEFVISIPLELSRIGGDYQYVQNLRSPDNENLDAVRFQMENPDEMKKVTTLNARPGSLFIFRGQYTLHRVTRNQGENDRSVVIISYHRTSGHLLSDGSKLAMYGRVD